MPSLPHRSGAAHERNEALERPRRVARWVTGLSALGAAAIAGVVAHQLPGAASASAPGSTSSSSSSSGGGVSTTTSAGSSTGGSAGAAANVAPSYQAPTVVSGGSSVR